MSLQKYYSRVCDYCGKQSPLADSSSEAMRIARRDGIKRYVTEVRSRERKRWGGPDAGEMQIVYRGRIRDVCEKCARAHPKLEVPADSPWVPIQEESNGIASLERDPVRGVPFESTRDPILDKP
jgi:hypothetical protein